MRSALTMAAVTMLFSHRRYSVRCQLIRQLLWHVVVRLMNLVLAVIVDQAADARLKDEALIIADEDVQ